MLSLQLLQLLLLLSFATKVDAQNIITSIAGTGTKGIIGDGGSATNAELNNPFSVSVDLTGNLYIADTSNSKIRKVSCYK